MKGLNIEIKARCDNLKKARTLLKTLGASFSVRTRQIDTYYEVPQGRLKMRQSSEEDFDALIFYEREDISGPKRSNVKRFEIEDACVLKEVLDSALKVKTVVDKTREIWWLDNVKIHLDDVKWLGKFVEFEVITAAEKDIPKSRSRANELIRLFEIHESELLKKSYSDMMLKA